MALLLALLALLKFTRPLRSTSLPTRSSVNRAWPSTAVSADVSNDSQVRTLKGLHLEEVRRDWRFSRPWAVFNFLGVFSPKEKLIETNSRNVSAFKIAGTAAFSVFAGLSSCFSSFWSSMGEQVFVPGELRVGVCPPSPLGGKEELRIFSWFRDERKKETVSSNDSAFWI